MKNIMLHHLHSFTVLEVRCTYKTLKGLLGKIEHLHFSTVESFKDERGRSQPSKQPTNKNYFHYSFEPLIPLNPSRPKKIKQEKSLEKQPFSATFLSSHTQQHSFNCISFCRC